MKINVMPEEQDELARFEGEGGPAKAARSKRLMMNWKEMRGYSDSVEQHREHRYLHEKRQKADLDKDPFN
jgi:hypothetical protein